MSEAWDRGEGDFLGVDPVLGFELDAGALPSLDDVLPGK